jgi:signal transduction histidine kinase
VIGNAIKYTPDGGKVASRCNAVEAGKPHIELTIRIPASASTRVPGAY